MRLAAAAALLALAACTADTKWVANEKLSDDVKARSYRSYQSLVLLAPKEDPRNIVPRAVSEFQAMGFQVEVATGARPLIASQGSGFVIGASGYVLTCAHVVGDQPTAVVTLETKRYTADVVKADTGADLALLKLRDAPSGALPVLSLRSAARPARMGEDIFAIGYPVSRMLGNGARLTKGVVSATTGLREDITHLQISAEIQPGSSGGPVLDHDGAVVGVVQKTMNPMHFYQATGGSLPQNINFSVKDEAVVAFVRAAGAGAAGELQFDAAPGLEGAARAVVKVQAGAASDDARAHATMVVRLQYASYWDLWYRFSSFVLTAFDFETQEVLFAAGQGKDEGMSDEDSVLSATFAQFRKALASR